MNALNDCFISTKDVSPKYALSYWNDYVCKKLIDLEVLNSVKKQVFDGSLSVYDLNDIQLCKVNSKNNTVSRTPQQIANSTEDYFLIIFQTSGQSFLQQDEKIAHLKPNGWTFTDSTRPYTLNIQKEFEQIVLKVPRHLITYGTSHVTSNAASTLSTYDGLGRIIKNFVLSVSDEIGTVDVYTRKHLANTLTQLLNDYFNLIFIKNNKSTTTNEMILFRIKLFLKEQINNADLSVQQIAAAFNCSRRQLYNIFSTEDLTINNYIKDLRIKQCKADLENKYLSKLSISEIAYKNGFNDPGTFVKLFKQKFNITPGKYRNELLLNVNTNLISIT